MDKRDILQPNENTVTHRNVLRWDCPMGHPAIVRSILRTCWPFRPVHHIFWAYGPSCSYHLFFNRILSILQAHRQNSEHRPYAQWLEFSGTIVLGIWWF